MTEFDLNSMNLEDLKQLQKDVVKAIEGYEERRRQDALVAVRAKARELGFTLNDLIGAPIKTGSKAKHPPKYRHPENRSLTWSGRGRQPAWLSEAIEAGKSLEDLWIKP